jgi:hypothetical protein
MPKLMQVKYRHGNLSLDKYGEETDRERAVLPAIVYAGMRSGPDRVAVIGVGWWKWGARITLHWRYK